MNSRLVDVAPYRIRVRGELDKNWFGWIDRVSMTFEPEPHGLGVTTLAGDFDQAALRGLLSSLWDMNLTVLSVDTPDAATDRGTLKALPPIATLLQHKPWLLLRVMNGEIAA